MVHWMQIQTLQGVHHYEPVKMHPFAHNGLTALYFKSYISQVVL